MLAPTPTRPDTVEGKPVHLSILEGLSPRMVAHRECQTYLKELSTYSVILSKSYKNYTDFVNKLIANYFAETDSEKKQANLLNLNENLRSLLRLARKCS